eukprot:scaffold82150_cov60-Phaeocystis_antarctica.AAC.3
MDAELVLCEQGGTSSSKTQSRCVGRARRSPTTRCRRHRHPRPPQAPRKCRRSSRPCSPTRSIARSPLRRTSRSAPPLPPPHRPLAGPERLLGAASGSAFPSTVTGASVKRRGTPWTRASSSVRSVASVSRPMCATHAPATRTRTRTRTAPPLSAPGPLRALAPCPHSANGGSGSSRRACSKATATTSARTSYGSSTTVPPTRPWARRSRPASRPDP